MINTLQYTKPLPRPWPSLGRASIAYQETAKPAGCWFMESLTPSHETGVIHILRPLSIYGPWTKSIGKIL